MINLKNRTEYSFSTAFGPIPQVLECNHIAAGICDRGGTWGHVQWNNKCKELNIKPIFGVELAVVNDMELRERQPINWMSFIAKNQEGLKELYDLATLATEKKYYINRIDYNYLSELSDNIIILSGTNPQWNKLPKRETMYVELCPGAFKDAAQIAKDLGLQVVATSNNKYPVADARGSYQIVADRNASVQSYPQHILDEAQWKVWFDSEEAIANTYKIADMCNVELAEAQIVKSDSEKTLRQLCEEAAPRRGIDLSDETYKQRLDYELDLIEQKDFADYFFLVADLCQYAKQHMLVGPARGSSCGSLVCYLLEITEIDPIPHNLLFERFIDLNRNDLPDIDIDFPDNRRELVFDYLKDKYGKDNVARLGTINKFKARSCIIQTSMALKIPKAETNELKNYILQRSGGDARASQTITDTFTDLEVGRNAIKKHPELMEAGKIEAHAKHSGQHAAGILVTAEPVKHYCAVDEQTGAAQVDKVDAETLGLLKIDALGLRTLSLLQDVLETVGWDYEKLLRWPLDDEKAFAILNNKSFTGIFQFEGYAVQSISIQMDIKHFEEVAAITALARPGPIKSKATSEYIARKLGKNPITYMHDMTKDITEVTQGVVVYQEQVMKIAYEVGRLSWEDVSALRKAMSKSLGKEFFDKFYEKFEKGANEQGIDSETAHKIWRTINTMGSWAFNRSHAVAYGLISYWCCVLKAYFPLEFAAACLRHAKDNDHTIKILREMTDEGMEYVNYDKDLSELNWSVQNNKLIGGLIGIKGVGPKTAEAILKKRADGTPLTKRQQQFLIDGETPYDDLHEAYTLWGHVMDNPKAYNINTPLLTIKEIREAYNFGMCCCIAKLCDKDLHDLNEPIWVEERGGVKHDEATAQFLSGIIEDDTERMMMKITNTQYARKYGWCNGKFGNWVLDNVKVGDWVIWRGRKMYNVPQLYTNKVMKLTDNPKFAKP